MKNILLVLTVLFLSCQSSKLKIEMVEIPSGELIEKGKTYKIPSFSLSEYETTVAQYAKFIEATGYVTDVEKLGNSWYFGTEEKRWLPLLNASWKTDAKGKAYTMPLEECNYPVVNISWNDANAFCKWAGGRLPTNHEFLYAMQYGDNDYNIDENAWHSKNAGKVTHPIGEKRPNSFGLYDIFGNAWEWCADDFDGDYLGGTPKGVKFLKVLRGGGWCSSTEYCQRDIGGIPNYGYPYNGFRMAISE